MGVTIKDIAEKTGLSITTISLVLNKRDSRIPERTRQIVENTAQELHYSPNHAAISLATKKTNTIGLIIPGGSYYRPDDMIVSFDRACRNAGYSLLFSLPGNDDEGSLESADTLLRRGVDGIIFDGSNISDVFWGAYRTMVMNADIPVVSLLGPRTETLPNMLSPDHRLGAELAVSHLLELGHTRIGCILGPRETCAAQELFEGIENALKKAGLESGALPVLYASYSAASGHGCLEVLLGQGISGIFAGSDIIAAGVFRRAYELGIRIPERLSVVGYGNGSSAADMFIPLTSVAVHFDRIARKAVHAVKMFDADERWNGPEQVQPSLIVRSSTAAPPEDGVIR
jgi:LacI family transcriptional regulator